MGLSEGLFAAYLALITGGGCMDGGSTALYEPRSRSRSSPEAPSAVMQTSTHLRKSFFKTVRGSFHPKPELRKQIRVHSRATRSLDIRIIPTIITISGKPVAFAGYFQLMQATFN